MDVNSQNIENIHKIKQELPDFLISSVKIENMATLDEIEFENCNVKEEIYDEIYEDEDPLKVEELNETKFENHNNTKTIDKCNNCGKIFSTKESSDKIIGKKGGLNNREDDFKCSQCLKPYKCDHCQKSFMTTSNLNNHIEVVHEGCKKYKCDKCEKVFGRSNSLQIHTETVHEGLKRHKCLECGKTFGQAGNLQTHIESVHEGLKKYKCDQCGKTFGQAGNLQRHMYIHTSHERDHPYSTSSKINVC